MKNSLVKIKHVLSDSVWINVLIIFFASFILRLMFLDGGIFHHDGIKLAMNVETFVNNGNLLPVVEGRQAWVFINSLFYFIPYLLLGAQSAELTINVVTALFGTFSTVMVFLLVMKLFNRLL